MIVDRLQIPVGLLCIAAVLLLGGCGPTDAEQAAAAQRRAQTIADREVQEKLFFRCLESIPEGPARVGAAANDWQEVVNECGDQAEEMSWGRGKVVKQ